MVELPQVQRGVCLGVGARIVTVTGCYLGAKLLLSMKFNAN